ncbi:MAG: nucleotide exchange factor GrpE [Leptospirales bacterium]|nr:nucleotide exchange factor GrpE [Leptospirales bacterium]
MAEETKESILEGVDVAPGSVEAEPEPSSKGSDSELEQARNEAREMRDSWNRERAEFLNFKKRTSVEMGRVRSHAVKGFVSGLLPVLDNLNQVLMTKSTDPAVVGYVQGVEMIRAEFINVLARENIQSVRPVDEAFDPMRMEAIAVEETDTVDREKVVEVYQDGFVMSIDGNVEVLRPARVRVARPAKKNEAGAQNENS